MRALSLSESVPDKRTFCKNDASEDEEVREFEDEFFW